MTLHVEVTGKRQHRVLERVAPFLRSQGFYLTGGTALALQLGHRHSVDLDWFIGTQIRNPLQLAGRLRGAGIPFQPETVEPGTLHGSISGIRVSFLEYRYALLNPLRSTDLGFRMASLEDLAAMKLAALAQRGAKKDFVDIYALGKCHAPLAQMVSCYQKKYRLQDTAHLLYALSYFGDAQQERLPRMIWNVGWREIQRTIQRWVKEVSG